MPKKMMKPETKLAQKNMKFVIGSRGNASMCNGGSERRNGWRQDSAERTNARFMPQM